MLAVVWLSPLPWCVCVCACVRVQTFFPLVQLRIKGNWGNPHHTCLYRFRVHGTPQYPPMEAK